MHWERQSSLLHRLLFHYRKKEKKERRDSRDRLCLDQLDHRDRREQMDDRAGEDLLEYLVLVERKDQEEILVFLVCPEFKDHLDHLGKHSILMEALNPRVAAPQEETRTKDPLPHALQEKLDHVAHPVRKDPGDLLEQMVWRGLKECQETGDHQDLWEQLVLLAQGVTMEREVLPVDLVSQELGVHKERKEIMD